MAKLNDMTPMYKVYRVLSRSMDQQLNVTVGNISRNSVLQSVAEVSEVLCGLVVSKFGI